MQKERTREEKIGLIQRLSDASGVSGFEDDVVAIVREEAEGLGDISEDSLRNLYIDRNGNRNASNVLKGFEEVPKETRKRPVVMLDAHTDEVGFIVQQILENGMLQFLPVGGWVPHTVSAQRVRVKSANGGEVPGLVSSKPPHYMSQEEKNRPLDLSQMTIDVGATSREDAMERLGIRIASPVVPEAKFELLPGEKRMLGKAFDCRVGVAAVLETLQAVDGESLDVDVVGALASQEEVGTRGAKVTAEAVRPDIAIVFEGAPADDTFGNPKLQQSIVGKGPMLRHFDRVMITNPRFQRFALDLAAEKGIPVQEGVRSGGGTNAGPIHLSHHAVPAIVVGVPVRYAHTNYGIAAPEDVQAAVDLGVALVRALDAETIRSF